MALEQAREAGSEYIGFVDSDDWAEPDMYETLLKAAEETNADIVECGYWREYLNGTGQWLPARGVFDATGALCQLFQGAAHDFLWNKLWKISCFDGFLFPPARAYADMIVTYRLFEKAHAVAGVDRALYHYRQNTGSIVHQKDMRLLDMWRNNREKYDYIRRVLREKTDPETYARMEDEQLSKCIYAIGKNWVWWMGNPREEQERHRDELNAMSAFVRENAPLFGRKHWERHMRVTSFMARYPNRFSLSLAWGLEKIDLKLRK